MADFFGTQLFHSFGVCLGVARILGHMGIHSSSRTNHEIMIGAITLWVFWVTSVVNGIGANWGTQATHPLELSTTVKLLKDNGFQKVKLFDADSITLTALKGSGLEVMVGIPNEMLYSLANSVPAAENWVAKNVSAHISSNSVNIRYEFDDQYPNLSIFVSRKFCVLLSVFDFMGFFLFECL